MTSTQSSYFPGKMYILLLRSPVPEVLQEQLVPSVAAFANTAYSFEPRTEEHCRLLFFHRQGGNLSICLAALTGGVFPLRLKPSSRLKITLNSGLSVETEAYN